MHPRPLLAVLLLSSLTLTVLDGGSGSGARLDAVRGVASTVLAPLDAGVGRGTAAVSGAVSAMASLADRSELARLRADNDRLRRELASGAGAQRELEQARALLGLRDRAKLTVAAARVVAVGRGLGFERTLQLDIGTRDGVRPGQPVLAGAGLLGRVVATTASSSTVLAVDDPQFGVGARLPATGALGLTSGAGRGRLRWVQVEPGPVRIGDALVTAGSDTFPPGLPVGTVVDVTRTPGAQTSTASVQPLADLATVELAGVVTGPAPP